MCLLYIFENFSAIDEKCNTNEDCTNYNLARCVDGVCKCEKGKRIKNWISTPGNSNRADCELGMILHFTICIHIFALTHNI